jgi:hypothetical protein
MGKVSTAQLIGRWGAKRWGEAASSEGSAHALEYCRTSVCAPGGVARGGAGRPPQPHVVHGALEPAQRGRGGVGGREAAQEDLVEPGVEAQAGRRAEGRGSGGGDGDAVEEGEGLGEEGGGGGGAGGGGAGEAEGEGEVPPRAVEPPVRHRAPLPHRRHQALRVRPARRRARRVSALPFDRRGCMQRDCGSRCERGNRQVASADIGDSHSRAPARAVVGRACSFAWRSAEADKLAWFGCYRLFICQEIH